MDLVGVTADVPVVQLDRSRPFYEAVLGRPADLAPEEHTLEWILHRDPEIIVRLVEWVATGAVRLGLGVADLRAERTRLARTLTDVPAISRRPGVIAVLELIDPDRNKIVLWQDLLPRPLPPTPDDRPAARGGMPPKG